MKLAALALALAPALTACVVQDADHVYLDEVGAVKVLSLRTGNGVVEVVPGERLRVSRSAEHGTLVFELSEVLDGDTLILDERCPLPSQCRVETLIELPSHVRLDLEQRSGELWLSDTEGPVKAELGAATVTGVGLATPELTILAEKADVALSFDAAPASLWVEVEVGGLRVDMPTGAYDLDVGSELGEVSVWNVAHDPAAPDEVILRTGAGDVALTGVGTSGG